LDVERDGVASIEDQTGQGDEEESQEDEEESEESSTEANDPKDSDFEEPECGSDSGSESS
jgi:hypothetical protein